ncbi:MAG: sensor histidine kinase, partial [Oscillospiraceae bacterium]|nr:sensor histidine kinase [Oscillospiraceae bacterium]
IEDGIVVNVSKTLFTAAVFNLIANSLDYRGQDDVKVSVSLRSNGDRCTLIYRDNSIGIKDELIEQVFNPFFSCDPYNDGEMTGKMGTGLYIVKQAVVQAGGTVLLQSEFGKGINLVISLPQADVCRGNAVKSMAKDFVLNRYSEVFVQLCEHCTLPDLI